MKMWNSLGYLLCILLAILHPSTSETIPEKLSTLLGSLHAIDSRVGSVLNITNDQCPCYCPDGTLVGHTTVSCDFEDSNLCGFTQDPSDDFDWTPNRFSTTSGNTGPNGDPTTVPFGYYMYIETSPPRVSNDVARLNSAVFTGPITPTCVRFWYHMFGFHTGTLNVYVLRNGSLGSPIWTRSGPQGSSWNMARVSLTPVSSTMVYRIVFEGIRGAGDRGDIAIDDFSVTAGSCSQSEPTLADMCTFEDSNVCGFTQDLSDNFNWTRIRDVTLTGNTGPRTDHTSELIDSGQYVYIEGSSPRDFNDVARLNSPMFTGPITPTCVRFWYHMFGSAIGTLNVYVLRDGSLGSPIWHLSGDQGDIWRLAEISLECDPDTMTYQIVFEGIRGRSFTSDIAIDDFSLTAGSCSPNEEVTCQDEGCFETRLQVLRNNLNDLTCSVQKQLSNTSATCPERTGAVFVAACDSPTVAVVDPNGFIQNGFELASNVTGWTLGPFDNDSFEFDYFRSEPFVLRCLSLPSGMEVVLGNSTDDPLSTTANATGIAYFEPTNEVYVAMTFRNSSSNGVYAFNRTSFPQIRLVFPYDGTTGRLYVSGNDLYMTDGQSLLRIMEGETSWTCVLVWSLEPIAFVVQDDGTVVFCEESGSVLTYSQRTQEFRQLKTPTANGDHCGDIALRVCDGLVYVALKNVQNLEIYNTTEYDFVQNLQYTLNDATICPSLLLDPRRC